MFDKMISKMTNFSRSLESELLSEKFSEKIASEILSSNNVDINKKTYDGQTYLHLCLKHNKIKSAVWLIKNGIDVSVSDSNGNSSLRIAVEKGNFEIINAITTYTNISIDQRDSNGRSLLQDAVIYGHDKIAEHLIDNNIDINNIDNRKRNVAFDAISYGNEEIIDTIVTQDDIDLNVVDSEGNTLLHNHKVLYDDNLASKLLENGADPTICDKDGQNFLAHTALRGIAGEAILEVAIRCGCDINRKVANENSILMEVMFAFAKIPSSENERREGLKSMAKKLINFGLDVDAIDKNDENVLFNSIRVNDVDSCAFLLENGVNVNQKNKKHESPLLIAAIKGVISLDIILLLLQYGANPLLKDNHSQTIPEVLNDIILHVHNFKELDDKQLLAKIDPSGNYMLVLKELLLRKNFKYEYLDSTNNPLFFKSFINGDIATTKLYLKHGLDINLKNKYGHNLFYEYALRVFEKGEYIENFRENLVFLLVNKSNTQVLNKDGQTIYMKVAHIKDCNLKLFRKLVEVARYDYKSVDNFGRTIIHACVWSNNIELLGLVYGVERNIQNISDKLNILPITYAAIMGNIDMVREFLRRDAIIKSNKPIHKSAKTKFQPMLKNLDKLCEGINDKDFIRKINILKEQILVDFAV